MGIGLKIQAGLGTFMASCNKDRTNQGRYCKDRTRVETLGDGLDLYQNYVFENINDLEERRTLQQTESANTGYRILHTIK
jgi:hypothetical protein